MPKTLLLADDSVTIQKVVGISFANEDVELVTVDNGDDAVARARELRPDLVLADVVMPGLSGYEVCHAIKSDPNLRGIPVLLLTGTFETFDEVQANEVGADGHITKPFEAQALVDQVNSLLASSPGAAAPATATEPESLGLTGLVSPGGSSEPYDLFEDDVTAPSHTADAVPIDSPPTTVLIAGEPLDEVAAPAPQAAASDLLAREELAPLSQADEEQSGSVLDSPGDAAFSDEDLLVTAGDPLDVSDLLAPAGDPLDASDLLAPGADPLDVSDLLAPAAGDDGEAPDLLAGDGDVLESGEPLDEDRSAHSTPHAPAEAAGSRASANLFGISDPGGATTLLADPTPPPEEPPAPDAPTVFEFEDPTSPTPDPVSDSAVSPPLNLFAPSDPAPETNLFSGPAQAPSGGLFSDETRTSPSPADLFPNGDPPEAASVVSDSPSSGMLYDDDPMGQTTLDPEAGRDYDVSSSDLGASAAAAPSTPLSLPSEPDWPADPEAAATAPPDDSAERHEDTPEALSPMLERQVHDAVEKMAWDAFGDLAEQIVKDAVERIERVAWEVIPQMTETLIREEIRKLKGED